MLECIDVIVILLLCVFFVVVVCFCVGGVLLWRMQNE